MLTYTAIGQINDGTRWDQTQRNSARIDYVNDVVVATCQPANGSIVCIKLVNISSADAINKAVIGCKENLIVSRIYTQRVRGIKINARLRDKTLGA